MSFMKKIHTHSTKKKFYAINRQMKMTAMLALILLNILTLTSCGRERLTPLVSAKTINELRSDEPINFSYKVDSTQIDEFARNTGKFPVFGKLFQNIAFVLANATISNKGGMELELEPIDLELYSSMEESDFSFIDWVHLDSLVMQIDNAKKKDSLKFIEKIDLYAIVENSEENITMTGTSFIKLVSFDKSKDKLECDGKCLRLNIEKINWKELIKNNPNIKLQPKIFINSVPKRTMSLAGSVGFSIKFNLGF